MSPSGAGDDLQVHAVLLVLAGVEGPVRGDPVDRDERPVEDDVGVTCPFSVPDRLAELRRPGREQFDDLVHVPPRRGPADPEPGRQLVERLAFAQVGEHEQGLLPRVQLPPPRPDRLQVPADDPGRVVQGPGRQRQRGKPCDPGREPDRLPAIEPLREVPYRFPWSAERTLFFESRSSPVCAALGNKLSSSTAASGLLERPPTRRSLTAYRLHARFILACNVR